jgi:long-chain acyl-CoA synthetase
MFNGYYKQPDKTAEVLRDGWLLTGDLGELDSDGFLKITGRKKELIITSTGKNIAPALIENLLREHHLISHAMVYGDGRSYLVALVTLNLSETESFARSHNIEYHDRAELTQHPDVREFISGIVAGVNQRVSSTEAIRNFLILDRDFTVEAEEITPTLKIKRNIVTERYRDVLESLYA